MAQRKRVKASVREPVQRLKTTPAVAAPDDTRLVEETRHLMTEILERERKGESGVIPLHLRFAKLIAARLDAGHRRIDMATDIAPLLVAETTSVRTAVRDAEGNIRLSASRLDGTTASARLSRYIPLANVMRATYKKWQQPISAENPIYIAGQKAVTLEEAAGLAPSWRSLAMAVQNAMNPKISLDEQRLSRDTLAVRASKGITAMRVDVGVMDARGKLHEIVALPLKQAPPHAWLGAVHALMMAKPESLRMPKHGQEFREALPSIAGLDIEEVISVAELRKIQNPDE